MTRIHLLTPSIVPGDAVSEDVLGMARWFGKQGYTAYAYAGRCHEQLRHKVRPLRAYRRYLGVEEDLLIYCHSVGWPAGMAFYERTRNRKIVRYQNVTPPIYYHPYNQNYVRTCLRGEKETRQLARSEPELWLAGSDFNAQGLIAAGADAHLCRTVPPLHRIGRLDKLPVDQTLAKELGQRHNLLFVGRLTPNKGHIHLIRTLAYYHHFLGGQAHLVLVGSMDPGLNDYHQELSDEVRRHRLQDWVHFRGKVMDRQLRTYYTHASAFVCASEHEGFCVPLVEAMYYGIPIVAYGSSAVAETLGDAGLAWETPSPALFAESIRQIHEHPEICATLVRSQRRRFAAHFTTAAIERRLAEALVPLLPLRSQAVH
jgi:glycosyltransferase involved in cell wall biosynthesis